jgi:hypothetical protein
MTTGLEIEDAILVARRIVLLGRAPAPEEAGLLARALLTITGSTAGAPTWVEPADLWFDRFRVWRDKDFWAQAWGPPPFHEGFRGSRQLLTTFLQQEQLKDEVEAAVKQPARTGRRRQPEPAESPEPKKRLGRPKGSGRKKAETVE